MTKAAALCLLLASLATAAGCDYARMYDQESVRPYKKEMPVADERSVPVEDGFQALLTADPKTLKNPLPADARSLSQGKQAYGYFCVQCHGPDADGRGTVGQSFSPLPTELASSEVQSQDDGELYAKIRLGYLRHPRLYTTISADDAWAVVDYIRSLARKRQ
jgi:mono/diheme cytochrome c family protein